MYRQKNVNTAIDSQINGKVTTGLPGNTPGAVTIDTSSRAAHLLSQMHLSQIPLR